MVSAATSMWRAGAGRCSRTQRAKCQPGRRRAAAPNPLRPRPPRPFQRRRLSACATAPLRRHLYLRTLWRTRPRAARIQAPRRRESSRRPRLAARSRRPAIIEQRTRPHAGLRLDAAGADSHEGGGTSMIATTFRDEMLEVVRRRHCERHPLTEAWARGELSREQLGRWAIEHYHYTRDLWFFCGRIMANCPVKAGRAMELDNLAEEENPEDEHNRQLLDFIAACGLDPEAAIAADPLD